MRWPWTWPAAAGLLWLAAAAGLLWLTAAAGCGGEPECPMALRQDSPVTVHVGSRVVGPALHAGRAASCDDGARARRLWQRATEVLARVPANLRPASVALHLSPDTGGEAVSSLEYHRGGAALLADGRAVELPDTVWLHEFAHVRMGRTPGGGGFAQAFQQAAEEGIADYYAATIAGQSRLGPFDDDGRGLRDLRRAPAITPGAWESVALANVDFDAHRLGWSLASAAWRAQPRPGPLLQDLLACSALPDPAAWLTHCPERTRPQVAALLRGFVPEPLLR